ncbi:hypothetical protein O3885_09400 [Fusobacterium sp. 27098_8_59]|uniref:hypothetical protein n=1 Tax=Fusobacterium sp. 27098_8_59 TaxID=3003691 RepID=UPI00352C2D73
MAIVKIVKRDCPYVTIDKTGVDDPNLSWAATGLLTYLIGRPGNWKINITHLSSVKTCKETATKSALKELREANYCHYFMVRKNGKISETFYLVFEVPTTYEEVLENYIDLKDGETILYQPVKIGKNTVKKIPQVENQLIEKNVGNKEVLPQVENPLVENLLVENQGLLIIDTTNKKNTNNRTTTNKKSSRSSEEEKIKNILEKYNLSIATKKNIKSLYLKEKMTEERLLEVLKVANEKSWGEGAIYKALKENWNIKTNDKDHKVLSEDEIRNIFKNKVNYSLNLYEVTGNFDETKKELKEKLNTVEGFDKLKEEYMDKFIEIIESKKIKESETKVNIQKQEDIIKNFLSLDKNIQKEIIDVAEKKYFKEFPEVERNVVFKKVKENSYFLYLKMLYPKLLDTLKIEFSDVLKI